MSGVDGWAAQLRDGTHRSACSAKAAQYERTHFCDAIEITVDMDDSEIVIERRFSYQQIRDGDPMPETMMMGKVALEPEGSFEDVRRRIDPSQAAMQARLHLVIVAGRPSGNELLQLSYRAEKQ